ncbi:hypothetical protein CR513_11109, partial [Mucuna pruriens]
MQKYKWRNEPKEQVVAKGPLESNWSLKMEKGWRNRTKLNQLEEVVQARRDPPGRFRPGQNEVVLAKRPDASQPNEANFVMPTLSSTVKMSTLVELTPKANSVPRWNTTTTTANCHGKLIQYPSRILPFSLYHIPESKPMENNNRTLKELAMSDSYELKSGLIHLLPKFHDLAGEDPHKHLKEFPFSLDEVVKDWLYLQRVTFNTCRDMKRSFLEKFFPASRTTTFKKEIFGIW